MYDPLTAFALAYRLAQRERAVVRYDPLTAFALAYRWSVLAMAA